MAPVILSFCYTSSPRGGQATAGSQVRTEPRVPPFCLSACFPLLRNIFNNEVEAYRSGTCLKVTRSRSSLIALASEEAVIVPVAGKLKN